MATVGGGLFLPGRREEGRDTGRGPVWLEGLRNGGWTLQMFHKLDVLKLHGFQLPESPRKSSCLQVAKLKKGQKLISGQREASFQGSVPYSPHSARPKVLGAQGIRKPQQPKERGLAQGPPAHLCSWMSLSFSCTRRSRSAASRRSSSMRKRSQHRLSSWALLLSSWRLSSSSLWREAERTEWHPPPHCPAALSQPSRHPPLPPPVPRRRSSWCAGSPGRDWSSGSWSPEETKRVPESTPLNRGGGTSLRCPPGAAA